MAEPVPNPATKHCPGCNIDKQVSFFEKKDKRRGLWPRCSDCRSQATASRNQRQQPNIIVPVLAPANNPPAPRQQRARAARHATPDFETPEERESRQRHNAEALAARNQMEQLYPNRNDQRNYCGAASIVRYEPTSEPHNLGSMIPCQFCGGLAFLAMKTGTQNDLPTFGRHCCLNGRVQIPDTHQLKPPPEPLARLISSQEPDAKHFRDNILQYNNALALTSAPYNADNRLNSIPGGNQGPMRMVSIHGDIYHYQGPLIWEQNQPRPAGFNQLFFYDPQEATRQRASRPGWQDLNRHILMQLHIMLENHNPHVKLYKTARERLLEQRNTPGPFRLLINPAARLVVERGADMRRENLPTANEVAIIVPGDDFEAASRRDIVLAERDRDGQAGGLHRIHASHALYMPTHYVLLFPHGELGWHFGLTIDGSEDGRLKQRQFWRFRITPRPDASGKLPHLFHSKKLFQKFLCDCFVTCDNNKLEWIDSHQDQIRADLYIGLADAFARGDIDPAILGRRRILPATHLGSDRWFHQCYQNSMAVQRELGTPTWFLTFTANPNWPEIQAQLDPGESYQDRADIVADVFNLKIEELMDGVKHGMLGPMAGYCYTIEYQKRGLPHMHLLIHLDKQVQRRYRTPQLIDQFISAELPQRAQDPDGSLYRMVTSYMLHGPCQGKSCRPTDWPAAKPTCAKRYPYNFNETTTLQENGTVVYRRRDNGDTYQKQPGSHVYTNRDVVPYNPYLLRKFQAHINLEYCASSNKAIKYLYKYVYKGTDRATIQIELADEIKTHKSGRYVSPPEAGWRLKEHKTHMEFPSVMVLQVHLKGHHQVTFDPTRQEAIQQRMENSTTTLIQFFEYNRTHPEADKLLYLEFPRHYRYDNNQWKPRQQRPAIGRMTFCGPNAGERFYLRLLLCKVRGPTSFEELFCYEGRRYETYQDACIARGLANGNKDWQHCLDEVIRWGMPSSVRRMFITGLLTANIPIPRELWDKYKLPMCEDLKRRLENHLERGNAATWPLNLEEPECDFGLYEIEKVLRRNDQQLSQHLLPLCTVNWGRIFGDENAPMSREEERALGDELVSKLNADQKRVFDTVRDAMNADPGSAHFYLQGPGGTGKTFLYRALTLYGRGRGKNILCVASTGIAALLLPGGRTAHSRFGIPLKLDKDSVSSITGQQAAATVLREADLIIWDEVPMQNRLAFECVDRLLQDIRHNDKLFGGVPVILGGDFSQILPVVVGGSRSDIVSACLQESYIWRQLKTLHLTRNMRLSRGPQSEHFLNWISSIPFDPTKVPMVTIPDYIHQPQTTEELIQSIYPDDLLQQAVTDLHTFNGRVIIAAKNDSVIEINSAVTARFPGPFQVYDSRNTCSANEDDENGINLIPEEELNSLETAALPPGTLTLKVGMPVMLMRNMNVAEGLCNGTRMAITYLGRFNIRAKILGGDFDGKEHIMFRIKLSSNDGDFDYILTRYQFPFKPCFAMTIHKSQGQSYSTVGVDLTDPCFVHGMLYVAMSRTSRVEGLHIRVKDPDTSLTENVSYPEVLIKPPRQDER